MPVKHCRGWSRVPVVTSANFACTRVEEAVMLGRGASTGGTTAPPVAASRRVPFTFRRCARVAFSWAERFAFGLKPVRNWYRSSVYRLVNARLSRAAVVPDSHPPVLSAVDRRASKTTRSSRCWQEESRVRSAIRLSTGKRCFDIETDLILTLF